jgi:isoleucyl-tRNA synthetase
MLNSELEVLKFWKENKTFEKSLEQRKGAESYVFLDGPPFITGLPTFGHISTGYPKDIFPRYWTQKGKHVARRWGWDCHGLPIENLVQKQLDIKDKRQIDEVIGVDRFNEVCRQNIISYDAEWRDIVERTGRWVDMDWQYRTMDNDYIESVWWGLGRLWEKNLLYKDYRVSMYSPSMGATLSHMEIADDIQYKNDTLETPVVRFKVKESSTQKLISKIQEEVIFNFSEQQRYRLDVEKRITILDKLDSKAKKANLRELLKGGKPEFSQLDWGNLQTDKEAGEELLHLKQQYIVILENLDTLQKLKDILSKNYEISLLSWTTTPWTLPANVALCVGAEIEYSMYYLGASSEMVILAENRGIPILSLQLHDAVVNSPELQLELDQITDSSEYFQKLGVDIIKIVSFTGSDLEGLEYKPVFEPTQTIDSYEEKANIFRVYTSEVVTSTDGTGILHVAPAYGAEDFEIRKQRNLPVLTCLNEYGEVLDTLNPELKPIFGKNFQAANTLVNDLMEKKGALFSKFKFTHKYPVYNRDDKKVYYSAQENWYIGETRLLAQSLEMNEQINWMPEHLKEGRFKIGLETAPDWCISRKRYWGTPLPIWQTEDKSKSIFVDSLEKLTQHAINPIYKLLNTRDLNPEFYELGKTVIVSDSQSKLPLGITATQYRSKNLTELRKEKTLEIKKFAEYGQKILDEILGLFEKYETVQIILNSDEQVLWTTWLLGLHPGSKKNLKNFYFYKQIKQDDLGNFEPFGSIKFLDLHRPFIDHIILKDEVGNTYTRIDDVIDCWIDSGSAPWASWHYPFENKELVEKTTPADYIVEYEGQIRGWFHALHILSTAIFHKPAFKNVHVHGTLLGNDGKKLSKSKKNFDSTPDVLLDKVGSDALRLYFVSGPFFNGETISMKDRDVMAVFRDSTLLLANSIKYVDYVLESYGREVVSKTYKHPLNKWWQAYTLNYAKKIDKYLEEYNIIDAARLIIPYINDFSTWYIRRSKDLLPTHGAEVATCLRETSRMFAIVTAALQPFNTERLWSVVKTQEDLPSVHLTDIPEFAPVSEKQLALIDKMEVLRSLVSEIHAARKEKQARVRQPLYADFSEFKADEGLVELLRTECNLLEKDLARTEGEIFESETEFGKLKVDLVVDKELSVLGFIRDFERAVQEFRKKQGFRPGQIVALKWQTIHIEDEEILQRVLQQVDWSKLCVEIKWVEGLSEEVDKSFEVKDLVKILVD